MRLPKAEARVEVVSLQALLSVDSIIATSTVRAVHPDLRGGEEQKRKTRPFNSYD